MRQLRTSGSDRGRRGDPPPYRTHGLGTAAPATKFNCVDSAGPIGYRASPRLYPNRRYPINVRW